LCAVPLGALRRVALVRHHQGPGRAGLAAGALQRVGRDRVLRVVPGPPRLGGAGGRVAPPVPRPARPAEGAQAAPMTGTDVLPPSGVADEADGPDPDESAAPAEPSSRRRNLLVVLGLTAVLAVPLVVRLGVLAPPPWYPRLVRAQPERRVRDVGGRHSPLVGLVGRINAYGVDGSHPGPLSFLSLGPFFLPLGISA